jgi:SAM-dependent methyltransferase
MDDRETVRRGYDELAGTYAERQSYGDRALTIIEEFLDPLGDRDHVLDAGCGHGEPVLPRVGDGTDAVGLDLSREQLRLAARAIPGARLVQGDMAALPFRAGAFDAVVAYRSVIHVQVSDRRAVFEEFARVLAPGGRVLLSEAPEGFERTTDDWLDGGVEMRWEMAGVERTRERLRDTGFTVTDEWPAPTPSEDGPEPPFLAARLGE